MKAFRQPPEQAGNPRRDLGLGLFAIGQPGQVGGIDHRGLRQLLAQCGQHGQPAHAGIEQQDRGMRLIGVPQTPTSAHPELVEGSFFASDMALEEKAVLRQARDERRLRIGPAFRVFASATCCGSIPFGLLLARLAGKGDIRNIGSGNIGATNVLRTGSKGLAAGTLLLDMGKGLLPVLLADHLFAASMLPYGPVPLAALGAVLGHCFPVWLGFRGGKGVATNFGRLAWASPGRSGWSMPAYGWLRWRRRGSVRWQG